jgi:large subunit ribosomal protein L10
LDVKSLFNMRRKLREAGSGYRVVKNNLFALAAKDTEAKPLIDGLAGPTAMVYTAEDPVATAKALQEFTKGAKAVKVKSGVVDGRLFNAAQITSLATIPPKPVLYAMVVGGLQSPITGLVSTLTQLIAQLPMTLQAIADQK